MAPWSFGMRYELLHRWSLTRILTIAIFAALHEVLSKGPGTSNGCDFEDGLCGWSHDLTDDFNWVINQGETPTANTGPMADHTKNDSSGHYLFVESSAPQTTGHKARFLSPFYNVESLQNKCLEFYYHMYGEEGENNVGSLEVFVRPQKIPTIALDTDHQIFYKTGNQRDNWIKADVIVPQVTEPVQ
uniref:MAM domain-containing protein n=1 Tax=Biomphalaria glabrata TaxID=6526 RepID=A0A2C9KZ22_BIOGL